MMAHLSKDEKMKMRQAVKVNKSLEKEIDNHNLRESSPESEDVDFKKIIHPIGYYIHDREQMIEEMFSIIKDEKLRKMLPPLLKNYTLEELKADCLVHLLGMSKKRIFAILEGRELNSSSDSESENSLSSSESDKGVESPRTNKLESKSNLEDDDLLDISVSEKDVDSLVKEKSKVSKVKRLKKKLKNENDVPICSIVISDDDEVDASNTKKTKKLDHERVRITLDKILGNKKKGKKRKKSNVDECSSGFDNSEQNNAIEDKDAIPLDKNDKGKTLLDILELEMRARAIRALLKNTPTEEIPTSTGNVKTEAENTTKRNHKIVNAVSDNGDRVSEQNISPKPNEELSESVNDVEIIDVTDVDLCVTIDDDEIIIASEHQTPATEVNENEKCEPAKVNEAKKSENQSTNSKDELTWSERWAETKNVKEVVKNSKICASIRKRMRFARMLKQKQIVENNTKNEIDLGNVDENSVAHFNLIKANSSQNTNTADNGKSVTEQNAVVEKSIDETIPQKDVIDDNISTEDHTLTILESDPKTLILDISDDDITSVSNSIDTANEG